MKKENIVVVGLGEVGKPLSEIISRHHNIIEVMTGVTRDSPTLQLTGIRLRGKLNFDPKIPVPSQMHQGLSTR
jgi:homoserine dehydrogenase